VIPCGTLKVPAKEMHLGIGLEKIGEMYPVDEDNSIRIALNALLVVNDERRILFDPGCGDFLPARLLKHYDLRCAAPIEESLDKMGWDADQITDVVFTHLHFDHCSGAFVRRPGFLGKRFPQADYHVSKEHYRYAQRPDKKEEGAFAAGLFRYVDKVHWLEDLKEPWLEWKYFHGHTRHMAVPGIRTPGGMNWYLTDLVPMESFLLPGVSSQFDLDPDLARSEKVNFLAEMPSGTEVIFFHDPNTQSKIIP